MPPQNGPAIRAIRRTAGRTQEEIATEVGIDQSYLSLIESERRTASDDVLEGIAKALNVPEEILRRSTPTAAAS